MAPTLTTPLLGAQPPASTFANPLADASIIVVADWAAANVENSSPAPSPRPIVVRAATRYGCDLAAAALAHAAAFWGLYIVSAAVVNPAVTLAACLTYHLSAVATGTALLAAAADAVGPAATRHAAPVAAVAALFCVQWGAFSYLFWRAGASAWAAWAV